MARVHQEHSGATKANCLNNVCYRRQVRIWWVLQIRRLLRSTKTISSMILFSQMPSMPSFTTCVSIHRLYNCRSSFSNKTILLSSAESIALRLLMKVHVNEQAMLHSDKFYFCASSFDPFICISSYFYEPDLSGIPIKRLAKGEQVKPVFQQEAGSSVGLGDFEKLLYTKKFYGGYGFRVKFSKTELNPSENELNFNPFRCFFHLQYLTPEFLIKINSEIDDLTPFTQKNLTNMIIASSADVLFTEKEDFSSVMEGSI